MLHHVILSLASNYEQERHLMEARRLLACILQPTRYTEELWTEPFGKPHRPDMYINQLLYATTSLSVEDLLKRLKSIELQMGRTAEERGEGIVRIDLDLMKYDDDIYHPRDWERPYIQRLLLS